MEFRISKEAKAYLDKTGETRLVVDMAADMTNSGCGCGKAKKFYTPGIRPLKDSEVPGNHHRYIVDGMELFISRKALSASKDTVTVGLEKTLFIKTLVLEGIDMIVED